MSFDMNWNTADHYRLSYADQERHRNQFESQRSWDAYWERQNTTTSYENSYGSYDSSSNYDYQPNNDSDETTSPTSSTYSFPTINYDVSPEYLNENLKKSLEILKQSQKEAEILQKVVDDIKRRPWTLCCNIL